MRRVLAAIVGFCVVAGGALAVAPPASATKDIPIGKPTVWAGDERGYPFNSKPTLVVGPATTAIQVLLPPEVDTLAIKNAKWTLEVSAGGVDAHTKGKFAVLPSTITLPLALTPAFLEAVQDPDEDDSVGEFVVAPEKFPGYDRWERVFPTSSGIALELPIKWDPATTATTAVADLRVPGKGITVNYSYHANLNSPVTVRRGQTLTFVSDQPGFFSKGPWSTPWPGRLEARYGWAPICGGADNYVPLRGCGGGVDTKPIPVKVSADGTRATVTFPKSIQPPPKGHGHTEIVALNWVPKRRFVSNFELNPKVPGTYEVVREVALR